MMKKAAVNRRIYIIAAFNILVLLIDKIILVAQGAVGAPLVLTLVLWHFIFKRKKWAFITFGIISLLSVILGVLGIFLLIAYLYRGYNPTPCLLAIIVGISYALSWLLLRKERKHFDR
ncbi:MAG: hypothetical protein K2M42_04120 [Oscillospiraceae bacterium]|nr:hypothetical protein [Oscillospiraceae bacterium]